MTPKGVPRHVHDYVMDPLRCSPSPQRERLPSRDRSPKRPRSRLMSCCSDQDHATDLQAKKGEP